MTKQRTILVVDDEQLNRQVILDILTKLPDNFSVLSANSGDVAIQIASRIYPDLILMDWNMPGMLGIDAVKKLKADEKTKEIPILMFTSINAPEKLQEAFEAGVSDYITKPVKKIELVARVRSALNNSIYQKEIITQKNEIEEQKHEITNSILYAQNIQKAILPKRRVVYDIMQDSFIFFKPRDIVSGDFYWFYEKKGVEEKDDKIFIAAADCTGHGVPGAFVSMIGYMLFKQIVVERGIENPGNILDELDVGIKEVFTREDNKLYAKDGMDLAICVFEDNYSTVKFAGAKNPLYLMRNSEISVFKGDSMPIGGDIDSLHNYSTKEIALEKGDSLYLFSDGYQDQFGGEKGKKLKQKGFHKILLEAQDMKMREQKKYLESKIEEWKGDLEQVDDILVIGIRV